MDTLTTKETETAAANRWQCPLCAGRNVQVSLPAWHIETADYELRYLETDDGAEIMFWYCPDCDESDCGSPTLADQ